MNSSALDNYIRAAFAVLIAGVAAYAIDTSYERYKTNKEMEQQVDIEMSPNPALMAKCSMSITPDLKSAKGEFRDKGTNGEFKMWVCPHPIQHENPNAFCIFTNTGGVWCERDRGPLT